MNEESMGLSPEERALEAEMMAADDSPEEPQPEEQPQEAPTDGQESDDNGDTDPTPGEKEPEPVEREKPPEGYVPHQAMHAERVKRQELERQLKELQEWKQSQEQPKEQPPEYKDPLIDPEGFRKWAEHQSQSTQQSVAAERAQREQIAQAQERARSVERMEQEFMAQTPDYNDAVQWFHNDAVQRMQSQGYAEHEINQQIAQFANGVFDAAQQIGMNPAELLYQRARSAGYQAPKPAPAPQQNETDRMLAKARAEEQTRGLGQSGGESAGGRLTAKQLAEMSVEQLAKVSEADLKAAFG